MIAMFDIVRISAETSKFGFQELFLEKEMQKDILLCENLAQAAQQRNKKTLVMVKELDFDLGSLKLLAEKKKACLLFDLSKIINSHGLRRSIEMAKMRTCLRYCNKFGVFYTFASFAGDESSIRSPRELIAICGLVGVNIGQAKFALKMIGQYLLQQNDRA